MPPAPKRPCRYKGPDLCLALVTAPEKYCDAHRQRAHRQDRDARGSSSDRGYGPTWSRHRDNMLHRWPLCGDRADDALIRNVSVAWECYVRASFAGGRTVSMDTFIRALAPKRDGYFFPPANELDPFSVCRRYNRVTLSKVLDHVEPVFGIEDPLFDREDNKQALCSDCDNKKKAVESRFKIAHRAPNL